MVRVYVHGLSLAMCAHKFILNVLTVHGTEYSIALLTLAYSLGQVTGKGSKT